MGGGGKPLAGGAGKDQAPSLPLVAPVGGVQFVAGVTPAGIWLPGMTIEPFGNTVVPCGKAVPLVKVLPAGNMMPVGTVTPSAIFALAGTLTPGGSTVPVGRL